MEIYLVDADLFFMKMALGQALEAARQGEVPIGAVLVHSGLALYMDHNRREQMFDATAHAELLVIRRSGLLLGGWRLPGTTLYVTLEPCPMCAGALVQARVERLVFGADDPKAGAAGSVYNITADARLNHRLMVTKGVLKEECVALLHDFFRIRRL